MELPAPTPLPVNTDALNEKDCHDDTYEIVSAVLPQEISRTHLVVAWSILLSIISSSDKVLFGICQDNDYFLIPETRILVSDLKEKTIEKLLIETNEKLIED